MPKFRGISGCCLALLLVCIFCARVWADAGESSPALHDFRDIPGITPEEISAVENLQKQYPSLIYGMLSTTETFVRDDNKCNIKTKRERDRALCDRLLAKWHLVKDIGSGTDDIESALVA